MQRQSKYTHLTERCSSIIKAFASLTIKQQTEGTVSEAYWRLRNGKGLLTPFDKHNLERWSRLITDVRRYASSPYSISNDKRLKLREKREILLEKMEAYRDWLSFGSIPSYMYQPSLFPDVARVALEYCLSGMLYDLSGFVPNAIPEEELKGWLAEINIKELIELAEIYANKFSPSLSELELRHEMRQFEEWPAGFAELQADKAWQIRTDMDRRSSVGAKINERLAWIWKVKTKSTEHDEIITQCVIDMELFKEWKAEQRDLLKHAKINGQRAKYDEMEVFEKVDGVLDSIVVPEFEGEKEGGEKFKSWHRTFGGNVQQK